MSSVTIACTCEPLCTVKVHAALARQSQKATTEGGRKIPEVLSELSYKTFGRVRARSLRDTEPGLPRGPHRGATMRRADIAGALEGGGAVYRICAVRDDRWDVLRGSSPEPVASFSDKHAALAHAMSLARSRSGWQLPLGRSENSYAPTSLSSRRSRSRLTVI
jgi:hypothetical protein